MHDEKEAASSDLAANDPDTSREAFMAAIVKLADDEAFRESFMRHYLLWLYPPMIVTRDLTDVAWNMQPAGLTFLSDEAPFAGGLRLNRELDESRANIERIIRDSGGAP